MGNIALTDVIPQDSLERQLYFIEKCKTYVADLQEKLGRSLNLLYPDVWVSDECEGL